MNLNMGLYIGVWTAFLVSSSLLSVPVASKKTSVSISSDNRAFEERILKKSKKYKKSKKSKYSTADCPVCPECPAADDDMYAGMDDLEAFSGGGVSVAGGANTIKICVNEMIKIRERASVGAIVECWDKDSNYHDPMASGRTGSDGCIELRYANQCWDLPGGCSPDVYCTVNKPGFMEFAPGVLDDHDQSVGIDYGRIKLYRDRSADSGHDNGCGPEWAEMFGLNAIATFITRFGEYCTMHDKCYWDCQIYLAHKNIGQGADEAQEFCDYEMLQGMETFCRVNRGNLPGFGEDGCLARAAAVYEGLQRLGGSSYDKTDAICPNRDGEPAPSMKNDYSHEGCYINGFKCGYDGTTGDDLEKCGYCCANNQFSITRGYQWNDYYCRCLPKGTKCASTGIANRFEQCGECCSGSHWNDSGYTYTDRYCN